MGYLHLPLLRRLRRRAGLDHLPEEAVSEVDARTAAGRRVRRRNLDLNQPLTPKTTMTEYNDPLLLDHEVDGIRELDNKLPRWWVWLFYLTIIFAAVYMVYYHVLGAGDLMAS